MSDNDQSIYTLRFNQITNALEGFGGGSPQWTQVTLTNVGPTQVPATRLINTTAPLMGGGNLSADRTLSMPAATSLVNGYLLAVDWTTFNGKQAAGSYITALTGDVTASGPGSASATLADTAVTPGAYTSANITVDSKGRITAASNGSGGGGTPGGSNGQIQYNSSGTFAGTANITTDGNDITLVNGNRLVLGNSDAAFLKYSTGHAGLLLQSIDAGAGNQGTNLNFPAGAIIYANTGETGSGAYDTIIGLQSSSGGAQGALVLASDFGVVVTPDGSSYGGNITPPASAKFAIQSTTQGFLPPKMTAAQRNAISSPATGLTVFNTDTNQQDFYDGSAWRPVNSYSDNTLNGSATFPHAGQFTGNSGTKTLPAASTMVGQTILFWTNTNTQTVTITAPSDGLLSSAGFMTNLMLTASNGYQSVLLVAQSGGNGWLVVNSPVATYS